MRTKKSFIFNEEQEAIKIIDEGFESNAIDYSKMYIVAKYFREKENLGAIRLEKRLIEFCKSQDKYFNPVTNKNEIQKWISSAMNYRLRKIKRIKLSTREIDFLKKVELNKDRKLLFVTLVFSKAMKGSKTRRKKSKYSSSENYYIRYNNLKSIIELSKISNMSEVRFSKILNKYKDHLLLYNPERELIKLEFADSDPEETITIENLDNLVEEYQNIFGKNMTYCSNCGKEILKTGRNQKYCTDCASEIRKNQKKEEMRERRKKD